MSQAPRYSHDAKLSAADRGEFVFYYSLKQRNFVVIVCKRLSIFYV